MTPNLYTIELVKHVFRYVSGTLQLGLKFDGEADTPDDMIRYTDSNFVGSKPDRKSTGGHVFMLAGAAISHSLKLQSIVALSTCEAEDLAMCEAGNEAVWLGYFIGRAGISEKVNPGHIIC